jgi:hypothetical protein
MNATEQDPVARMAVPSVGGGCGVVFVVLFVGSFVALAVDNLVHYSRVPWWTLIPSVLWLGIVAFALFVILHQEGVRQSVVALLGAFSRHDFVEAAREGDRTVIGFGFTLFSLRFYYVRVPAERVASVCMGSGQGTALAGRDMDDWHVTIWYDDPDAPPKSYAILPANELHIIGPSRAKATTEEWFRAFIAFLRAAGVELHPTEKEHEFRTPNPDRPGESELRSSGEGRE